MSQTTFRDCRVHLTLFPDNFSRNSCIRGLHSFSVGHTDVVRKSACFVNPVKFLEVLCDLLEHIHEKSIHLDYWILRTVSSRVSISSDVSREGPGNEVGRWFWSMVFCFCTSKFGVHFESKVLHSSPQQIFTKSFSFGAGIILLDSC